MRKGPELVVEYNMTETNHHPSTRRGAPPPPPCPGGLVSSEQHVCKCVRACGVGERVSGARCCSHSGRALAVDSLMEILPLTQAARPHAIDALACDTNTSSTLHLARGVDEEAARGSGWTVQGDTVRLDLI